MEINCGDLNKKKRGRRKKNDESDVNIHISIESDDPPESVSETVESTAKKRGRKPKGGKLTLNSAPKNETVNSIANIILHLKCSLNDLNEYNYKMNKMVKNPMEYDPAIPPVISTYNNIANASPFSLYEHEKRSGSTYMNDNTTASIVDQCMLQTPTSYLDSIHYSGMDLPASSSLGMDLRSSQNKDSLEFTSMHPPRTSFSVNNDVPAYSDNGLFATNHPKFNSTIANEVAKDIADSECDNTNIKDINAKLKKLKIHLYKNINYEKKSACFWCTYDYDNPTCYIPKYEMDDKIYGYGSFCRPECAVAYLMKENIDDSMKFERYHLLNQIYSKVYDFKKNIKPAPNPYFLLEKYYGNLTIQEYRKLLKTEHMLLVIDKPLTRILPELHEDNEDILLNTYASGNSNHTAQNNTGVYKVKRSTDKTAGPSKASIIKDSFGLA